MTGPTDSATADRLARLTPQQRELLLRRLGAAAPSPSTPDPIPRRAAPGEAIPLSAAQRRIWFFEKLQPGTGAYNLYAHFRLTGPLRVDAMQAAFRTLVERHDALRTVFFEEQGEPRQRVLQAAQFTLDQRSLRELPADARDAQVDRIMADETAHAFDLSRPLLRATLLQLDDAEHVLLVVVHHIVADAWSCGRLLSEMQALYAAHVAGEDASLAPLALGHADAVLWQLGPEQREKAERDFAFWRDALSGTTGVLDLPTDHPRAAQASGAGARYRFRIDAGLSSQVAAFARGGQATVFMAWLCAFEMLLARLSGQCDIVVGAPIANRTRPELEPLMGLFVNTLPFRGELSGDPSFREALARTRAHCLDALDNADVALERLVDTLGIERVPGRSPLFQVMFVLQNASAPLELPRISVAPLEPGMRSTRFELTLSLTETSDGMQGAFDYDSDLFDEATIARWARQLEVMLHDAVADPDRPLSALRLLDDDAQAELLGLATGARSSVTARHLMEPVSAQAARTPDATALVAPGESISYRQMMGRVNALAAVLQGLGVGPEQRVALIADRSPDALIGLLAILAAGGAYVPLDPSQPDERLRFMLGDTRARAVLAPSGLVPRIAGVAGSIGVVAIDQAHPEAAPPACEAGPSNAAYVIYTSGSTGQPKGVVVEHRGALNLVEGFQAAHAFRGQRLLMIPPLIFDASVGDIFPALASGATLVMHPDPARLGAAELRAFCRENRVTAIDAPAALWRRWAEGGAFDASHAEPLALDLVMIGGEAVPLETVRRFARSTRGRAVLTNHYGPTEASVCATVESTRDGHGFTGVDMPIGRPLAGVRTYVLDARGRPAPRGVIGELHIGGAGVARGYLGQPALTAERFVPDPFAAEPGARMYRTGDLARWDATGRLQFLGRRDHQTKLRGLRVELGEVETALASFPGVTAAAAIVREDRAGDRRLVGYVVAEPAFTDEAMRAHLARLLPEAILPSVVVHLEGMPLTPNGKVDRKALPAPATTPAAPRALRAPSTATEEAVLGVWKEVLARDDLGVDDDFFAAGGDSLLTLPLVFRLHASLGVELPLSAVFATPTVAGLAREIDTRRSGGTTAQVDLHRHVQLPAEIDPSRAAPAVSPRATPRCALVTGATGFLGAYIVRELLDTTSADIVCLVRAADAAEGLRRIRANLDAYGLWRDADERRILPLPGDLATARLGLDEAAFAALAARVDVIFHNGGQVNFLAPYEHLEAANVGGTREVLRLATMSHVKPVHLVSTLGVYLTERHLDGVVREDDAPPDAEGQHGGYNQSKWVGEQLGLLARARGLPVAIYRPARITADSRTGASNPGDYFNAWMKGCVQLGLAPLLPDESFDMAPVDHVGRAIVRLALGAGDANGNFHFYNSRRLPVADAVAALRAEGFAVREVPYREWRAALLAATSTSRDNALAPFAGLFPENPDPREPAFDCARTESALAAHGLVMPPADRALFAAGLRYLKARGALPVVEDAGA